jgi:hypothetical protein
MAMPVSVQTANAHSTTNGPASIAPSWSATVAGNTLIAVVASALSGAPTISTPAAWTAGPVITQGTAMDLRMFYYKNNPGSITTATFNLTNVAGIAVGFFEISGLTSVQPYDINSGQSNSNASSTAVSSPVYTNPPYGSLLYVGAVASISTQALTPANVPGKVAWVTGPTDTSTTGATNVTLYTATMNQGSNPAAEAQIVGTLAGAGVWCAGMWAFLSTSSAGIAHAGIQLSTTSGAGYATGT